MRCLHASSQPAFGAKQQQHGRRMPLALRAQAAATRSSHKAAKQQQQKQRGQGVAVALTATSFSSRKLQATVDIRAPLPVVWEALTDYDNLGTFIPSLAENRCLERREHGCLLYQVGAQDVAMGIKFSAACTLEITEYPFGIPRQLCTVTGDLNRYFPCPPSTGAAAATASSSSSSSSGSSSARTASATPSASATGTAAGTSGSSGSSGGGSSAETATTTPGSPYSSMSAASSGSASLDCEDDGVSSSGVRDISFCLVEGDFQAFKGIWRMQPGGGSGGGADNTTLHYSLFVRPHPWLPVKLIEDRISSEVVNNLAAVRRHAERVHKRQQQQQQQASAGGSGTTGTSTSSSVSSTGSSSATSESVDS